MRRPNTVFEENWGIRISSFNDENIVAQVHLWVIFAFLTLSVMTFKKRNSMSFHILLKPQRHSTKNINFDKKETNTGI